MTMASNSILPPGLENLAITRDVKTSGNGQLATADFLKLMLTQIQHQDPLKPMENGQFLSQLAQFGTVNGIAELKTSFDQFATSLHSNQALQASTMVGRSVMVAGDAFNLNPGAGAQGAVELGSSTGELLVTISDASGQVVRQINMGSQPAGTVRYAWDGLTDAGEPALPGTYRVTAQAIVDNKVVVQPTYVMARVDSVTLAQTDVGPVLNLQGMGPVPINQVKEIE